MIPLPIDEVLPEIVRHMQIGRRLVLQAPPGAGKTTRVPVALQPIFPEGELVVLEPRRLAARLAAKRIADELGEPLGKTVGYTVRFEDVSSKATRIRFMTEGVLTRRLFSDPTLKGVSCVLLDEFHERHLHTDLALAWTKELQATQRPDLGIVVMSATLATESLGAYLRAPIVHSEGKAFPVDLRYLDKPDERPLPLQVVSAVRTFLDDIPAGDVLVFLPGARDIRETKDALASLAEQKGLLVLPLHGELSPDEQDRALLPTKERKVILSTNVAESSVTIPNVRGVIDAGLVRMARIDPWSGLGRLETAKVCRSSMIQRAGRAGRTGPGIAYRLTSKSDFERRAEFDEPEVGRADLSELTLFLASLGRTELDWLEPPNERAKKLAHATLRDLQAIDSEGRLTEFGRQVLQVPLSPRVAAFFLYAGGSESADAVLAAAILQEGGIHAALSFRREFASDRGAEDSDLIAAMDDFDRAEADRFSRAVVRECNLDLRKVQSVTRSAEQLRRLRIRSVAAPLPLSKALLKAYRDRVARRLKNQQFALVGGRNFELGQNSVVRYAEWVVVLDGDDKGGKIVGQFVSKIEPDWLLELFPEDMIESEQVEFNTTSEKVRSVERLAYRNLTVLESEVSGATHAMAEKLAEAAKAKGYAAFAPEGQFESFRPRLEFAASLDPNLPAPTDELFLPILLELAEGKTSFAEMRTYSIVDALLNTLTPSQRSSFERLAPERIVLPSGRTTKIHYEPGKTPYVASRLQDFFGCKSTPTVGKGTPLVLHLLAPNQRAVQVSSDLEGFWRNHYPTIRKELMRRYPRHAWPENPV